MEAKRVYYLWGAESYLIDQEIKGLAARMHEDTGEEPELVLVDADELSPLELGETLQHSALFALSRIVVIKNPAWLGKNARQVKKAEEIARVFKDYLSRNQAGQLLVICSPEHHSTNPLVKMLDKEAQTKNIKPLTPKALGEWLKKESERRDLKLDSATQNLLVNSGQDMYYLINLLEKLSLMKTGRIDPAEIEAELDRKQEIKVFKLTDALLSRNLAASLEAFYQLQEQGMHYLLMLHMINNQLVVMSKIKFYQEAGYSPEQIAGLSKQKDFVIRKMMEKGRRFSDSDIRVLFKRLLEVDISLKGESKNPQLLMETLIVEFCSP